VTSTCKILDKSMKKKSARSPLVLMNQHARTRFARTRFTRKKLILMDLLATKTLILMDQLARTRFARNTHADPGGSTTMSI
jgi:hypothetical protein